QRILMPRWKIKALNSSGIRKLCSGWRKGKIAGGEETEFKSSRTALVFHKVHEVYSIWRPLNTHQYVSHKNHE
ncbi:hypothetical protein P4C99_19275, partial [Pontiellaceae bacterium B1224]|nr:hypothetical protein [Pontiellaceae bacterium B1224]